MVLVVTFAIVLIIAIIIVVICCVRKRKNESESRSRPNLNRSEIDYNPAAKRAPSNYYLSPREWFTVMTHHLWLNKQQTIYLNCDLCKCKLNFNSSKNNHFTILKLRAFDSKLTFKLGLVKVTHNSAHPVLTTVDILWAWKYTYQSDSINPLMRLIGSL